MSRTILLVVLAGLAVVGCTVNEATGKRQLDLVGEAQELELGREADRGISAEMGIYDDPALSGHVERVGRALAAVSERPQLPWSIKVVDDPIVNAFALPGGYLYVSRGILAHFGSEAELAAVLGHEVGHVTARHGVERMSKAQLATIGFGVAMIASESFRQYGGAAQLGMQLLFLKFSRDDERESDDLGLRYVSRAGWATSEMPRVFDTLERVSATAGARTPEWAATHPSPERRAQRLRDQIAQLPTDARGDRIERDSYLRRLDGMVFGADPRQGYSVGSRFYHPGLAFQLEAPRDWSIVNETRRVLLVAPNRDAIVQLDLADAATPDDAARTFFQQQGIERGSSWRPGYIEFRTTPDAQTGRYLVGVAGFLSHQGRVFRILGYTRDDSWGARRDALAGGAGSFRRLDDRRYLDVMPARLEIVATERATTIAELARARGAAAELAQLAVLNGVAESTPLPAGHLVKMIKPAQHPR